MDDISRMIDLLSYYEKISFSCVDFMEKWQHESQEYKENTEFDNLATEYFGE